MLIGYYNTKIMYTTIILRVGNRGRGSVLGTGIRLPTLPVYACKYNYIKNLK